MIKTETKKLNTDDSKTQTVFLCIKQVQGRDIYDTEV